jgi:phosphoserine phosphatase RsbU/P
MTNPLSPPDLAAVDLGTLIAHRTAVPAATTVEAAHAEFVRLNVDFMAVRDGEKLLGLCARRELVQALGSRFGFALNARRAVSEHLMAAPLRVERGTSATEVFKAAAARAEREFYDDVLLVGRDGRYEGMISMHTLVRLQTEFLIGHIARVEASRLEIAAKNHEMRQDLDMAREVQMAMLPQTPLAVGSEGRAVRLAHRFRPAGGVSGDFFDIIRVAEDEVGVLICDVMGHGVRSALITAMVRAMVEELRAIASDPGATLTRLNRDLTRLLRQTGSLIFVTAAYAVFQPTRGRLRYAQAGHPTALRLDGATGAVRTVACSPEAEGPALGLMDEFEFVTMEEPLGAGDRVLLFTDGTFEAANAAGEEFGPTRLAESLAGQKTAELDAALDVVLAQVTAFCGGAPFADDVCLVGVECEGPRGG